MEATDLFEIDEKTIGDSPAKVVYIKDKKFKTVQFSPTYIRKTVPEKTDMKRPSSPPVRSQGNKQQGIVYEECKINRKRKEKYGNQQTTDLTCQAKGA